MSWVTAIGVTVYVGWVLTGNSHIVTKGLAVLAAAVTVGIHMDNMRKYKEIKAMLKRKRETNTEASYVKEIELPTERNAIGDVRDA